MQFFKSVLLFFSSFILIKSSDLGKNNPTTIISQINVTKVETIEQHDNFIGNHEVHTISQFDKTDATILEMKEIEGTVLVKSQHMFDRTDVKFMKFEKNGEIKITNHEPNLSNDVPVIDDKIFFYKILTKNDFKDQE